jgi:hypothetical protein
MARKTKQDPGAYAHVSLYFDLSNPYQKECYELLEKAQRKKTLFLSLVTHDFLGQFDHPSSLTKQDIKKYIEDYELLSKLKKTGGGHATIAASPIRTPDPVSSVSSVPAPFHEKPAQEPVPQEPKPVAPAWSPPPQKEPDPIVPPSLPEKVAASVSPEEDTVMAAMNLFTV